MSPEGLLSNYTSGVIRSHETVYSEAAWHTGISGCRWDLIGHGEALQPSLGTTASRRNVVGLQGFATVVCPDKGLQKHGSSVKPIRTNVQFALYLSDVLV